MGTSPSPQKTQLATPEPSHTRNAQTEEICGHAADETGQKSQSVPHHDATERDDQSGDEGDVTGRFGLVLVNVDPIGEPRGRSTLSSSRCWRRRRTRVSGPLLTRTTMKRT